MKKTYVTFASEYDWDNPVVAVFSHETNVDPMVAFKKACEEAKNNGFRGYNTQIPKDILKKNGLSMRVLKTIDLRADMLEPSNLPISLCTCSECSAYEDGHCFKWGGRVDGDEYCTENDCIHSTGGLLLTYNGAVVFSYSFWTEMEPFELVEYLMSDESGKYDMLDPLKEELRDFLDDNFEKDSDVEKDKWDYKED